MERNVIEFLGLFVLTKPKFYLLSLLMPQHTLYVGFLNSKHGEVVPRRVYVVVIDVDKNSERIWSASDELGSGELTTLN